MIFQDNETFNFPIIGESAGDLGVPLIEVSVCVEPADDMSVGVTWPRATKRPMVASVLNRSARRRGDIASSSARSSGCMPSGQTTTIRITFPRRNRIRGHSQVQARDS